MTAASGSPTTAFQLAVNKRFSGGLAYQVAYTFSRRSTRTMAGSAPKAGRCRSSQTSLTPRDDLPHILTVNANYELPVGQETLLTGSHVVGYIIGGWQTTGS
jgi:hypothetical protein